MRKRIETPFDSIENAQDYIKLLVSAVDEAKADIDSQVTVATNQISHRRVQALRIVLYNLEKLRKHLTLSGRTLNDLRSLRRILLEERFEASPPNPERNAS